MLVAVHPSVAPESNGNGVTLSAAGNAGEVERHHEMHQDSNTQQGRFHTDTQIKSGAMRKQFN